MVVSGILLDICQIMHNLYSNSHGKMVLLVVEQSIQDFMVSLKHWAQNGLTDRADA